MNILSLIGGALALRTDTFKTLRERSDVFYRGFLVVLVVGVLAGAFAAGGALVTRVLRPPNVNRVTQEALRGFENSYTGPPELKPVIASYIQESVAMAIEIDRLQPQAGAYARPIARLLRWLGETLAMPLGGGFLGLLLLGGLLVHLSSRWLGGRAGMAQMLGLGALGFAPQLLDPISSLLTLAGNLSGVGAFGPVRSLIGLVALVWGVVIYVKATAIAQQFSYLRAIGAIIIAVVLAALLLVLIAVIVGLIVGGLIASLLAIVR